MEEEIYAENSTLYAETKDVAKLKKDSKGRVIFRAGKRKSYHFVCKECGEKRYIRPSDIERGRGNYCTMECFHANDNPRVEFVCPICGTGFSVRYNKAKKFKTHYCSKECYIVARTRDNIIIPEQSDNVFAAIHDQNSKVYGRTHDISKLKKDAKGRIIFKDGKRHYYVCRACGKVRGIPKSYIRNGGGLFCSRECCDLIGQSPKFIPDLTPSPTITYLIGALLGDGNVREHDIRLQVQHFEFAESVANALRDIGLHPTTHQDKKLHSHGKKLLWHTRASSKPFIKFYLDLKNDREKLKQYIQSCPNGEIEFIHGMYESEGDYGVYNYKRTEKGRKPWEVKVSRNLRITNTDENLITLLMSFLQDLGFHPMSHIERPRKKEWKDIIRIRIPPKEHDLFFQIIKPVIKNKREERGSAQALLSSVLG